MGSTSVKISAALSSVKRLYVDVAPLIYYIEEHPLHVERMEQVISLIENTPIVAVSSAISLTEVLHQPILRGRIDLEQSYQTILLSGNTFRLYPVTGKIAVSADHLRARYNLKTPDALHVATALELRCDAFITNDKGLRRVTEIAVLVVGELEVDSPPS